MLKRHRLCLVERVNEELGTGPQVDHVHTARAGVTHDKKASVGAIEARGIRDLRVSL
jgi:hypothetical protein